MNWVTLVLIVTILWYHFRLKKYKYDTVDNNSRYFYSIEFPEGITNLSCTGCFVIKRRKFSFTDIGSEEIESIDRDERLPGFGYKKINEIVSDLNSSESDDARFIRESYEKYEHEVFTEKIKC